MLGFFNIRWRHISLRTASTASGWRAKSTTFIATASPVSLLMSSFTLPRQVWLSFFCSPNPASTQTDPIILCVAVSALPNLTHDKNDTFTTLGITLAPVIATCPHQADSGSRGATKHTNTNIGNTATRGRRFRLERTRKWGKVWCKECQEVEQLHWKWCL